MSSYGTDDENLGEAILQTLAEKEDTTLEALPSLYKSIDPDALDTIFNDRDGRWIIQFEHAGYWITVKTGGEIELEEVY